MLVSAISNNRFLAVNNGYCEKSGIKNNDNVADTTFNSLNTSGKSTNEKDLTEVYDAINRWKLFCHKQIEAGNLDIIV